MIDHEQRIADTLRAVTADVRARPDLAAGVRRGALRRRRRNRVGAVAAGAAAVVLAVTGVALVGPRALDGGRPELGGTRTADQPTPTPASSKPDAPLACAVDRLPIPGGQPKSLVTGGDRTGRYLLGRAYGSTQYVERHPILIWDDGRPTAIDMPGADEMLNDINSAGVAVGSSFETDDTQRSYVYRDGALRRLTGNGSVEARAIGEQGVIVGSRSSAAGQAQHPVVWRGPTGPMADLPAPAGWEGTAADVDADGTIVGTLTNGKSINFRGYAWAPDGTGRQLPLPEIDGATALSFAPITIDHGVVFGRATKDIGNGGFEVVPVLFDLRTERFTVLTRQIGFRTGNARGWVAGSSRDGYVVASPGGRASLPGLPGGVDTQPSRTDVVSISTDGRVLGGQAVDGSGEIQAVRWTCSS
jgi:hypothetical protein